MATDTQLFDLIQQEKERQLKGIELIASENFTSTATMRAMGSVLTNKYAEGYPGRRYYGGCEVVDEVERLAIARLKELFGAEYANVQPHSGAQANAAVFLAVLKPGDAILGFDLAHGGHLSHGSPVNFSGKVYQPHFYGVEEETGTIDMDKVAAKAREEKPDLILMDVVMPELNGFQATRKITRDPATEQIPVILVTTKDQETDKGWGQRQGAAGYIIKPPKEAELIAKINEVLG